MNPYDTLKHSAAMVLFTLDIERYIHSHKPEDFPRVSTKGHFDITWGKQNSSDDLGPRDINPIPLIARSVGMMRDVRISNKHTKTDYELIGEIPGIDGDGPEEVMIFTHGWLASPVSSLGRLSMMDHVLKESGYSHPVIGFTWDSGDLTVEWDASKKIARMNGAKLAQFTYDYKEKNPDTKIRLISNSLASIIVLEALKVLHNSGVEDIIDTVSLLGAASPSRSVAVDGRYGAAISKVAGEVHNYWIENDGTLNQYYNMAEDEEALGGRGAIGVTPSNYFDHNVEHVPDHFSYYRKNKGCIPDVLSEFREE